jgi:hypothetical protein
MLVEIGILHDSPPFGGQVYHALLPTEIPQGPIISAKGPFVSGS